MNCCVGTYNLCINQGATYIRTFIWNTLPSSGTVGSQPQPVDLTGYTVEMQIRPYQFATIVLFDATPDILLGGTAGTIALTIPAADTETFTWWKGVYDIKLTSPTGVVTRFLEGSVTVSPAVSQ